MDFSFLSQGQPVQLPNPLQNALQAMTLGQLAQRNELGNLQIQMQQRAVNEKAALDRVLPALQQANWSPDAVQQAFAQEPDARNAIMTMLDAKRASDAALQKTQSETIKNTTEAQKQNADRIAQGIGHVANAAAAGAPLPQIQSMANFYGVKLPDQPQGVDDQTYIASLATVNTDPKTQLDMLRINKLLPYEVGEKAANIAHMNTETQFIPMNAQSTRISANAAASNAATAAARQQYGEATVVPNPITGESSRVLPGNAQNPAGVALPVSNAQGQPAQTGAPAMTSEVMKANAPRFAKAADDLTTYNKVLQSLPLLKATLQSGYTGPLIGSDEGKQALAILSTIPGIGNVVDMDKLANSKAADAIQGELIGDLIKEISTRGSNMATKVVLARKPGTENPLQSNLAMIDALEVDSKNGINNAQALLNYAQQNPRDITLSGFKAPVPKLPPNLAGGGASGGQTFDSMPDPSTLPGRKIATTTPDGATVIYQSTPAPGGGFQWMRQ